MLTPAISLPDNGPSASPAKAATTATAARPEAAATARTRTRRAGRTLAVVLAAAAALGAWTQPGSAWAGEPPHSDALDFHPARDPSRAASAFARGKELYVADKLDEALAAFREAERFDPGVGAYLANLGTVEIAVKHWVDAATHLDAAIGVLETDPQNAAKLGALRGLLDQARAEVTRVSVECNAEGASVALDGQNVAITPLERPIYVEPGEHVVRFEHEGYEPQTLSLTAEKGAQQTVSVALAAHVAVPEPPPPVPDKGPDRTAQIATVTVGSIVSAGLLGAAIGATVGANAARADSDAIRAELDPTLSNDSVCAAPQGAAVASCTDLRDALTSGDHLTDAAIWLYVAAGASTLGTVLAGALWPSAEEPAATVTLVPSPDGAALFGRVAF